MDEEKRNSDLSKRRGSQMVTMSVTVPPDGGWGWVIVIASFISNMVVDGIVFSFGPLLQHIAAEFKVSNSKASIAGSLLSGFYLISGPFVSAVANRYGFRFTGVVGCIFSGFIFAIASLSPTIEFLWLFYGLLGGIGFGMIYVPAVITVGYYFEKWRALATGICVSGSGIGTIVMGPLTTVLIKNLSWRGTLLVQSGIILSCALFNALYRPLKPIRIPIPEESEDDEEKRPAQPLLDRIKMVREHLKQADSHMSIDEEVELTACDPTETTNFLRVNNNVMYPTAADALRVSSETLSKSVESVSVRENNLKNAIKNERNAQPYAEIISPDRKDSDDYDPVRDYMPEVDRLQETIHNDVFYIPKKQSRKRCDSINFKMRSRTTSESSHRLNGPRRNTMPKLDFGVRPLYRDDIFFQASLHRLPLYQSHVSGLDYTMSVTRLPTWKDVQEEEEGVCRLCPEAVRRTLATMLDLSLLRSVSFVIFALGGFVATMGVFIPFMFLADRAVSWGYDRTTAVFLVSAIGITNTIGRIICGALTSIPGVSGLAISNAALTVGGIATIFSSYSQSSSYQFCFAAVFGLAISFFASLRSIIAVEMVGLEKLTNAFGIVLLFQGLAAAIGAPIAGLFLDLTGSYELSFSMAGWLILASGVMCYPLEYLKRREIAKEAEKNAQKDENEDA